MGDQHVAMTAETDRFFREIVLCLGGIFAAQEVDDTVVWQVTKSLDHIYQRARSRLLEMEPPSGPDLISRRLEPHPAVEDLLARIGP